MLPNHYTHLDPLPPIHRAAKRFISGSRLNSFDSGKLICFIDRFVMCHATLGYRTVFHLSTLNNVNDK